MYPKNGFIMSIKRAKNVCNIYSKKYLEFVQNVNIFFVKEQQEEHNIPPKYMQNVNKMFVNVHKQITHDVFKS